MAYYIPTVLKSGGARPSCPPPNCAHEHLGLAIVKSSVEQRSRKIISSDKHKRESAWILELTASAKLQRFVENNLNGIIHGLICRLHSPMSERE